MNLEIECWILDESVNEAVSCEKRCCGRDFIKFRYEYFPYWKSIDISEYFTQAAFDYLLIFNYLQKSETSPL